MAKRLRIVLVTCLLVFILMDANPVLGKKDGKFQKLELRVKTLEDNEDGCKPCSLIDQLTDRLNEMGEQQRQQQQEIEQLKNPPTPTQGAGYALFFPQKGTSDYVIKHGMPSLTAVTVCFWVKTADTGHAGTLLSYAISGEDNELLLYDYRKLVLWVGGKSSRQTSVSANDGKWHHICSTWENTAGSWKLFKDGNVAASGEGLQTGQVIRGGGALVLGQEQDSLGGSFDANQCFIGEMTGVNVWDRVITDQEIMQMSQSCLTGVGSVFQWRDFKGYVKGSVKIIHPSC